MQKAQQSQSFADRPVLPKEDFPRSWFSFVDSIERIYSEGYSIEDIAESLYQHRKVRVIHPFGSFDNGGRWHADSQEKQVCCETIRRPSRAFPYSELSHCRTHKHCLNLVTIIIGEMLAREQEI